MAVSPCTAHPVFHTYVGGGPWALHAYTTSTLQTVPTPQAQNHVLKSQPFTHYFLVIAFMTGKKNFPRYYSSGLAHPSVLQSRGPVSSCVAQASRKSFPVRRQARHSANVKVSGRSLFSPWYPAACTTNAFHPWGQLTAANPSSHLLHRGALWLLRSHSLTPHEFSQRKPEFSTLDFSPQFTFLGEKFRDA